MLPPPTISFTIPSIHDDLVLQCRIYHPVCLAPTLISHLSEWRKKAAIVAHPYAPLGGCYDDPVVNVVASEILKQGFVVGTFNFRGAGTGHTSWSSKAEQEDYLSFAAFMIYYMYHLSPPALPFDAPRFTRPDSDIHDLSPIPSRTVPAARVLDFTDPFEIPPSRPDENGGHENTHPRLLLAGYSYGSLITTLLPPIISSIIPPFQTPLPGSAQAEIRLRASCLALQQNQIISDNMIAFHNTHTHSRGRNLRSDDALTSPKTRKSSGGVRMGGDENLRRASQESHRSRHSFSLETQEKVRKSVDRVRSIAKARRSSPKRTNTRGSLVSSHKSRDGTMSISSIESRPEETVQPQEEALLHEIPGVTKNLQAAYLLVSPLQGVIGSLATMWSSQTWKNNKGITENEMKLVVDPSLAIFGDDDVFVSAHKLREWSQKLADAGNGTSSSLFRYVEVEGAGHFWHDHQRMRILQNEVSRFVQGL